MSKPDDIPQDVWDAASSVFNNTEYEQSPSGCVEYIARAILAAKAEEREEVARLIEDYQPDLKPWDGPTERSHARSATDYACIDLATAIRARTK